MEFSKLKLGHPVSKKVMADNLEDIAAYTVELHEFLGGDSVSEEASEAAKHAVLAALWEATDLRPTRKKLFEQLSSAARSGIEEVAQKAGHA